MSLDDLTADRLHDLLDYNPETGVFVWRVTLSNRCPAGTPTGSATNSEGYLHIGIAGARFAEVS